MFELIHRAACCSRQVFESDPHESGTADVVALDSGFAARAAFHASDLFAFPVPLLNLPTVAAPLLGSRCGVLSPIVSDDPVRAAGRHHYSEQGHLMVFLGNPLSLIRWPCAPSVSCHPREATRR